MTQRAAWLHDHAEDRAAAGEAANMAKYAAAEAARALPRRSHPDARRQRHGDRVRHRGPLGRGATPAHRARQPRDGPQLRRAAGRSGCRRATEVADAAGPCASRAARDGHGDARRRARLPPGRRRRDRRRCRSLGRGDLPPLLWQAGAPRRGHRARRRRPPRRGAQDRGGRIDPARRARPPCCTPTSTSR